MKLIGVSVDIANKIDFMSGQIKFPSQHNL
jgi:hypothetical protein